MEIVWVAVLLASLLALPPLRRRCYYLFLAAHIVALPTFVLATLLHSWDAWRYSLAGIALCAPRRAQPAQSPS